MTDKGRINGKTLHGAIVGISISADAETACMGFGEVQVTNTVRRVSDAVLGMGGRLVFGHDWRPGGVMEGVLNIALQRRGVGDEKEPAVHNLVPWPDRPALSQSERLHLRRHLCVEEAGLPDRLLAFADPPPSPDSDEGRYLRARGLTHLRKRLTQLATARLCMGGRHSGSSGCYPGILEEALLALVSGQPLYVTSLFGGTSARIVQAIEVEPGPCPPDFAPTRDDVRASMRKLRPEREPDHPEVDVDAKAVWRAFNGTTVADLSGVDGNGLDEQENRALFHAQSIQAAVHLVLRGLVRLQGRP
ncbi:MAG: hypothetical protein GY711_24900 [bacterium]|nr:hypothetical protein [bacterium]